MAELASRADDGLEKVAIVADVRESGFPERVSARLPPAAVDAGLTPRLIFLEATPSTLVRRFSETRRPHPLAPDRSVAEGIREERAKMNSIRAMADLILDTSNLTVHELRDVFMRCRATKATRGHGRHARELRLQERRAARRRPRVRRPLPAQPAFRRDAAAADGPRPRVVRYMRRYASTREFLDRLTAFLTFALPQYVQEGKSYLTVAIGCTAAVIAP
jgi:UPF0042 nucleotide-binding protein